MPIRSIQHITRSADFELGLFHVGHREELPPSPPLPPPLLMTLGSRGEGDEQAENGGACWLKFRTYNSCWGEKKVNGGQLFGTVLSDLYRS
jgi:hypothetical protein